MVSSRHVGRAILVALAIVVGIAAQPADAGKKAQIKAAKKLLKKIKRVDGAGSGLDADKVRAMTPDQLKEAPK